MAHCTHLRVVPSMINLDLVVTQVVDADAGSMGGARVLLSGASHHWDLCRRRSGEDCCIWGK